MYQSPKQGKCSTVVRQRMQARKRPQPSRSTAAAAAAAAATAATAAASASISVRRTAIFSSKSAPSVHSSSRWILRVSANSSTAATAYDHPCTRRILCIPSRTSVSYPTATTTTSGRILYESTGRSKKSDPAKVIVRNLRKRHAQMTTLVIRRRRAT